jgi:hypothetical protein
MSRRRGLFCCGHLSIPVRNMGQLFKLKRRGPSVPKRIKCLVTREEEEEDNRVEG